MATDDQRSQNELDACEKTFPTGTHIVQRLQCWQEEDDKGSGEKGLENEIMTGSQPALSPLVGVLAQSQGLQPGEHSDIRLDVNELLANGEEWLVAPNTNYGGRRPSELIGTPDEILVRNTLRSVIYSGMA
jgi:hypothetical protein